MTTKQITASNADEKIKQLYETAFPEDEQIPWEDYDDDNNASNITHKSYF
jgi:hypothetical protein